MGLADVDDRVIETRRHGPRRWRIAAGGLLILTLIGFAILWTMRERLAADYIDSELASRGVRASYEVKRIGFGTQVIENLVIGDPARPDLTARRVEVNIGLGLTGPRIGLITARGVRLRGRIADGRLHLGEIDRLLPPPSGAPFSLPDQAIDVADAAIGLETPAGAVGIALAGRGNLADGFRGQAAIVSRELAFGDCRIERAIARLRVGVSDLRPDLAGPVALGGARCGEAFVVEQAAFDARAGFTPALDGWEGQSLVRIAGLRASGHTLESLQGRISFGGNARRTEGQVRLASGPVSAEAYRATGAEIDGRFDVAPAQSEALFDGRLSASGLAAGEAMLARVVSGLRGARGTPVGPVADALATALHRAGSGGAELETGVRIVQGEEGGALRLTRLALTSASGARLDLAGGEGVDYRWPGGALRIDGGLALSGGGFPEARFLLRQADAGAPIQGSGRIAPMAAGSARLALDDISFTADAAGRTNFRTSAIVDGPFSGGRVSGLAVPLSGRFGGGDFALGEGCVTAAFQSLQVQGLRLGASRLPLCPVGRALVHVSGGRLQGGAMLSAPRFGGTLGGSPIALGAARLRIDFAGFAASDLAVRLGSAGRVNRLDIADLTGRFGQGGIAGDYRGLGGDIANVPLIVSAGQGSWRFRDGRLDMDGHLMVADSQDPRRFEPLTGDSFALALADNRIRATAALVHPGSGARVALATINHDLGTGAGDALLDVTGLRFSPGFQPEALTPLTIGVVALVDGELSGHGRIAWDESGVRSTGRFATDGMNLAAPFGPVEGLSTAIDFTDLLGLTSAPGQEARVDLVRTGIDVFDGEVRYQLRPNYHVAVESARWPLAGGILTLEPTMLDFSQESTKYLTFRVEALDAARFVQQMEFSNIAATGTFDGVVPMQFTSMGGRVVDGRLHARPEGGTLSYIGELTDEDLGAYGILVFDALKSMRYSRLGITLNGDLGGEFLTRIDMDGIARDPEGTRDPRGGISGMVVGRVMTQLARIPLRFAIRIEGPFRALVATARSFEDPSDLIRASLPQLAPSLTAPDSTVQPQESEPVP